MKNLKKLISVILAVIMIVGSFATVSAADYADVESTNSYYKAIKVLSGLGIAKGDEAGNFNPTADVKRSEMVTFICRAMGEEDIAVGAAGANFTDVAANHWAAGYIAWGVNRGIINGMGDGTFAPDAPVKYQDAVVMIMRALGYDRIAQRSENGGYPTGYLRVASSAGVLTNAGYDSTKEATREIIAQLINNALTAPTVEVSSYGVDFDDDRYVINKADEKGYGLKCLLTTVNKIWRVRATVVDSFIVNADLIDENGSKVQVDYTRAFDYNMSTFAAALDFKYDAEKGGDITGQYLYVGDSDLAAAAQGDIVEVYVTFDEDLNEWVALAAVPSTSVVEKEIANVIGAELAKDSKSFEIKYKENITDSAKKAKAVDIKADAVIYVNGDKTGNGTIKGIYDAAELASVGSGAKAVVDYLNDASAIVLSKDKSAVAYESIFAVKYQYAVVKEVNVAKNRVSFRKGTSLKLDTEDRNDDKFFYGIYDAEGNEISLEDIKADDVLNIVTPNDAKYDVAGSMVIYVTSNVVEGSVDEQTDLGYIIAGDEYAINKGVTGIAVGKAGKFFVSIDGKVVYADATAEINSNFAVVSYAEKETKMGKATFDIDLLTKDGALESYTLASKVKFFDDTDKEGKYYSADTTVTLETKFAAVSALLTKKTAAERLITFKVNADGEVSEIRLPGTYNYGFYAAPAVSGKWDADFSSIGSFDAADAALLIVKDYEKTEAPGSFLEVKKDGSVVGYSINEEEITVASFADLANGEDYTAKAWQTEDEYKAYTFSFALSNKEIGNKYIEAPLAVVKAVSQTLVDDVKVDKITFVQSGEEVYLTVEEGYVHGLAVGDVFQYAVNAKEEIEEVKKIVDLSAGIKLDSVAKALRYTDDKYAFAIGYLADANETGVKLADGFTVTDDTADFAAAKTASFRFADGEGYTFAAIDYAAYKANATDKYAVEALEEAAEIESSTDAKEVAVVIVKLNEYGRATDIISIADVKAGLKDKAEVSIENLDKKVPLV